MQQKLILFLFTFLWMGYYQVAHALDWVDSVEEGLQIAKNENKPVLVYLYHPTSLSEDRKVWLSSLVQSRAENFVPVQINIESDEKLIQENHLTAFPVILFYDSQGRELMGLRYQETSVVPSSTDKRGRVIARPVKRALNREDVARRLKKVQDEIERFALIESQFENYKDKPQVVLEYAKGLRMRRQFDQAEKYYSQLINQKSIDQRVKQEAQADYIHMYISEATYDFYMGDYDNAIDRMHRFLDIFPDDEKVPNAKLIYGMSLYESGSKSEGEKVLKELTRNRSAGIFGQRAELFLKGSGR